jgi:hypothetical protein
MKNHSINNINSLKHASDIQGNNDHNGMSWRAEPLISVTANGLGLPSLSSLAVIES